MESRVDRIETILERLERVVDKLLTGFEGFREELAGYRSVAEEVKRVRTIQHEHANKLALMPMIEKRLDKIMDELDRVRVVSARNSVIASLATGVLSAVLVLLIKRVLG